MRYLTTAPTTLLVSPAVWAVVLPALGALVALAYAKVDRRISVSVLAAVHVGVVTCATLAGLSAMRRSSETVVLGEIVPGAGIVLHPDPAGALFAIVAAVLWLVVFPYAVGYLGDGAHLGRYHAFSLVCLAGMMGVAYAANLLTLLVFFEIFSVMSYALIAHEMTGKARAAGRKYMAYVVPGGSLLVMGTALAYAGFGRLTFGPEGIAGSGSAGGGGVLAAVAILLIAGFGVKAALVPLHGWVADAHPAAPAPFSALLSGVMVAAGGFAIVRVVYGVVGLESAVAMGLDRWLAPVAAVTVLFGAVVAVGQDDLKRRLAYSTISQMAYVVLGVSMLEEGALAGALVHIANHGAMKGGLFLCAGLLLREAGIVRVSEMAGIAHRYPVTMGTFTLFAIGMIGIPPLAGFVSKWILGRGMIEAGSGWYLAVLLAGAALAALYLLPVVRTAYFDPENPGHVAEEGGRPPGYANPLAEAPASMLAPIVILGVSALVLGMFAFVPGLPLSFALAAAETLLGFR